MTTNMNNRFSSSSKPSPIIAADRLHAERIDAGMSYDQIALRTGMSVEHIAGAEMAVVGCYLSLPETQSWCDAVGCSVLDVLLVLDLDAGMMARCEFVAIGEDKTICYLLDGENNEAVQRVLDEECGGGIIVPTRSEPRRAGWEGQDPSWRPADHTTLSCLAELSLVGV